MTSEEMVINTRQDWESILAGGAVIVWEEKLFKIFRQPDGRMWRAMPAWRRAWPFDIIEKGNAGDPGSSEAHNLGMLGSTPRPATPL